MFEITSFIHHKNVKIQRFREELQRMSDSKYMSGKEEIAIDKLIEMYDKHFHTSLKDKRLLDNIKY
jgi:hypothetical protein